MISKIKNFAFKKGIQRRILANFNTENGTDQSDKISKWQGIEELSRQFSN